MPNHVCIETERLILKTITMEDAALVASSWKLDEPQISTQEAEEQIRWMMANHAQNQPDKIVHLCLAIVFKDTGECIGWCGLDQRDLAKPHPVLFYLLKASFWGQGLATEAARAVLGYAFGEFALNQVDSAAAFENLASKRVMEKLGMHYLGLDAEGGHAFTLTKDAFRQLQKNRDRR